jgi:GntR family transcriptional regulator/MocR family aminotransferase
MHAYVIEDDYDSEFRYGERPIAALQGLDESDSVIYVGTFAKTMFPAIRAAYLVAPPALVDTLEMALRNTGHLVPVVLQAALADFIREGHLASHLRHMRMVYGERRKALVEGLTKFADSRVTLLPAHGGMQLCALLHDVQDDRRLVSLLAESGVNAAPLSEFYLGRPRSGLVLGFAGPDLTEINAGVRIIAEAIDRMRSPG